MMDKEQIAQIRRLIHDEFWEIWESELLPVLKDYVGVKVESSKVVETKPEDRAWSWDPSKIAWTKAEGFKGEYERSEDVNSLDFKALLKDLAEHKGTLTRDGLFYWAFQNGSTVGRKKR